METKGEMFMNSTLSNIICYSLIILGVILLVVSNVYLKSIVPKSSDIKVSNEQEFLKSKRTLYTILGICYIALGCILILNILKLSFAAPFIALLPFTQMLIDNRINKKYVEKIDS